MHHKHGIRQNVKAVCCRGRGSKYLGGIRSRPRPQKNSHNVKILKILGNVENCNSCMSEAVHVSPSYA